jgi:hypothetical protein
LAATDSGVDGTAAQNDSPDGSTQDVGDAGALSPVDTGATRDGPAPAPGSDAAAASSDGAAGSLLDGGPLADASEPDAPVGPIAGQIACGSATCAASTQFCCALLDGGASCQTSEAACAALGGAQRQCEKAADCPANNVCCYEFSILPASASCHANDCNGGGGTRVEACRSQGDCATGTCSAHECLSGGSIQSCAAFATECP